MNKIIIITGASRGIGKEAAKELAREGNKIIANYNNSEKEANELKKELENENIEIDIFKADVSKREECKKLAKYVIDKYGKIDVLINNAGISQVKLFTDITDEDWNKIISNNLYSAFCMTQEVLPKMINCKSGCIINISSVLGVVGASCESIYAISKAGMDAMTKSLAKELGPSNIRVNSIAPGFIDTNMNNNLKKDEIDCIIKDTPLQKVGMPMNIVNCINWLIDDDFTTGQVISVNGGWLV